MHDWKPRVDDEDEWPIRSCFWKGEGILMNFIGFTYHADWEGFSSLANWVMKQIDVQGSFLPASFQPLPVVVWKQTRDKSWHKRLIHRWALFIK